MKSTGISISPFLILNVVFFFFFFIIGSLDPELVS